MTLPWLYHDFTITLPWISHDFTMTLPWFYHDLTMILPWPYHDLTMSLPWPCLDLANLPLKFGQKPLKFGQIGSVTVEIFLIWTNVARKNLAWTNVTVTVLDVPRNLPLKFGQNRASNSCDIADMDKCRQDKCHLTVGICSRCSQEPIFKSWS